MSAFQQVIDCQDLKRFIREYLPPHPIALIMMEQYRMAMIEALLFFNIEYKEELFINVFDFKRNIQSCLQCKKLDVCEYQDVFCCKECETKFEEDMEAGLWRCAKCDYGWVRNNDDYCEDWIRDTGNKHFILCPECDTDDEDDEDSDEDYEEN